MIGIFSGTDMIKKVPICFFEVPICLIEVPNYPDADLSCYRNVSIYHRTAFECCGEPILHPEQNNQELQV
jgi:hypothetical protein